MSPKETTILNLILMVFWSHSCQMSNCYLEILRRRRLGNRKKSPISLLSSISIWHSPAAANYMTSCNDQSANKRSCKRLWKVSFFLFTSLFFFFVLYCLFYFFLSMSLCFVCSVGVKLKIRAPNTFFQALITSCRWNRPHSITLTFHEFKFHTYIWSAYMRMLYKRAWRKNHSP
jgi:hypothetical protein